MPNYDALTEQDVIKLADALIKWSLDKDSLHLAGFSSKYNKTRTWLYGIAENHPTFRKALEAARDNLAQRYVSGCMKSEYTMFAEKYLPIYDKEYKDLIKWKADIQRDISNPQANKPIFDAKMKEIMEDEKKE